ncbi:MAG: hypothetical protein ACOWWM_19410 [Desulfobacterales bacterium]
MTGKTSQAMGAGENRNTSKGITDTAIRIGIKTVAGGTTRIGEKIVTTGGIKTGMTTVDMAGITTGTRVTGTDLMTETAITAIKNVTVIGTNITVTGDPGMNGNATKNVTRISTSMADTTGIMAI